MDSQLVGFWSSDWGYDSAMEDEWLVLRADGTGWRAYLRPWYTSATLFRWALSGPGTLRVDTYREVVLDEWDGREDLAVTRVDQTLEVAYRTEQGTRPLLDSPVSLLTVDLPFLDLGGAYAFADPEEPRRDFLHSAGIQSAV
ncbi:hypothetical protein SAMN05421684_6067 [Asanoa ishikariensis]|uniref:Uncharacterized protein n=1 Tax=Asanoa ishikariensis TaxID=137265 RepID=A0A1H3TN30_9ACTN|nr:hypothetical protein [Asanoa ishikariensis]SDZ51520.1 hypothetical protein SAMN05421684_6067 [Asanoa ishikariensis]